MPELNVTIPLQPKQAELSALAHNSKATWLGFGGSRGGAKSHGGRSVILLLAWENPNTRWFIVRRTWELVRENHVEPLLAQFPYIRPWYRSSEYKEIGLPNGSVIAFRYAENRRDVEAMIGKEYHGGLVDQAEAFAERDLNTFKSIVRWPGGDEAKAKLILTFNPGNIGHSFLKRIFYDKKYQDKEHAEDYAFIQAFGWDNWEWARASLKGDGRTNLPHDDAAGALCKHCQKLAAIYYGWDKQDEREGRPAGDTRFQYFINRTQYGRDLNALPQAMRIGWLLGRMDQFAGQYYDIFSQERHVRHVPVEEWHTRWLGIDWGFAHNAACHWCSQVAEKLTAYYREFVANGHSPKALAQEIVDRTPPSERPLVKRIFLSHDAFAKRDERDTIADQMAAVFRANGMPYPETASRDPMGRAALLYTLMQAQPAEVVIDPQCKKLLETIPMVCRDEDHPERPLKFEGDDAFDSATHALTYRMQSAGVPHDVAVMNEANKITDPYARWFYLRKHYQQSRDVTIQPKVIMPWEAP